MSYLDDMEEQVRTLYRTTPVDEIEDTLVAFVREQCTESFKNGLAAAKRRGASAPRSAKRRPRARSRSTDESVAA